jgi:hypothetical protein
MCHGTDFKRLIPLLTEAIKTQIAEVIEYMCRLYELLARV